MFEIGFMELVMVAVVALVVVGPERLPGLARTVGAWAGRARGFLNNVKADIDRELKAEELKRILEQQAKIANPVHQIIEETKASLNQAGNQATAQTESGLANIRQGVEALGSSTDESQKKHEQS